MTNVDPRTLVDKDASALTTPCLVVDPDDLDFNLRLMAEFFRGRPCRIRPHFKSHKCVTLAKRQLAAGSIAGITCAKVSEAEQLVGGGVEDVLIANQVVGEGKIHRLVALNRTAAVRAVVDSAGNVADLGRLASEAGIEIGVLVEVDIGMNRCGVPPGEPALELARQVDASHGVRFDGLQGYEGHLVGLEDPEERRRRVTETMAILVETRRLIEGAGLGVRIVSSAGTGTYDVTGTIEGIDEVQCGSYALMDVAYKRRRPEFRNACHVLATVISSRPGKIVADVGVKGMGCEFGPPVVVGWPDAKVLFTAEEHTAVEGVTAAVGDRLRVIPSHGCTTTNLHRRLWLVRDGVIADVWPIEGSGCLE